LKEPIDGDCLILSGVEFQTVGAAKLKALRPIMAVVVKGTCSRLCEEDRLLDAKFRPIGAKTGIWDTQNRKFYALS